MASTITRYLRDIASAATTGGKRSARGNRMASLTGRALDLADRLSNGRAGRLLTRLLERLRANDEAAAAPSRPRRRGSASTAGRTATPRRTGSAASGRTATERGEHRDDSPRARRSGGKSTGTSAGTAAATSRKAAATAGSARAGGGTTAAASRSESRRGGAAKPASARSGETTRSPRARKDEAGNRPAR